MQTNDTGCTQYSRWAGIDPRVFPLNRNTTRNSRRSTARPNWRKYPGLRMHISGWSAIWALKLGLRDQEVQFAEFTDISCDESVFRVRSKPKFDFTVKDYEERDIPITVDF